MYIFMAILKMRANICTYFKNACPLMSSTQNIDILSGSPRSANRIKNIQKIAKTGVRFDRKSQNGK